MEEVMAINWSEVLKVENAGTWLATTGIRVAAIIVGAFVVTWVASFLSHRAERLFDDDDPTTMNEREKRAATLGKVIRNVVRVIVSVVALLTILRELGLDIAPLLAGVGIAGIAIGFGAQSIVKDFLGGMLILIENQFGVGDVISAGGASGLVEKITLRTTTLRDLEGKVHVVPNGQIETVTNMTKKWSRFVVDIGVAYKENVDHVMSLLKEVGDSMSADPEYKSFILEPLDVLGVEGFADSAVLIRVMFTTMPLK
jgi:small-conductance mechanosensitive channel